MFEVSKRKRKNEHQGKMIECLTGTALRVLLWLIVGGVIARVFPEYAEFGFICIGFAALQVMIGVVGVMGLAVSR